MKKIVCLLLALCALVIPVALSSCGKPDFSEIVGGGSSKPSGTGPAGSGDNTGSSGDSGNTSDIVDGEYVSAPCDSSWGLEDISISSSTAIALSGKVDKSRNLLKYKYGSLTGYSNAGVKTYEEACVVDDQANIYPIGVSHHIYIEDFCYIVNPAADYFAFYYSYFDSETNSTVLKQISGDVNEVNLYYDSAGTRCNAQNLLNADDTHQVLPITLELRLPPSSAQSFRLYCFGVYDCNYNVEWAIKAETLGFQKGKTTAKNGEKYIDLEGCPEGLPSPVWYYQNKYRVSQYNGYLEIGGDPYAEKDS